MSHRRMRKSFFREGIMYLDHSLRIDRSNANTTKQLSDGDVAPAGRDVYRTNDPLQTGRSVERDYIGIIPIPPLYVSLLRSEEALVVDCSINISPRWGEAE